MVFKGIKVLDFTWVAVGPLTIKYLAVPAIGQCLSQTRVSLMNDKGISTGGTTEPVQDLPFPLEVVNLCPLAIGYDDHRAIVRDAAQHALEDPYILIPYRKHNGEFLLNAGNDVAVDSLGFDTPPGLVRSPGA